MSEVVLDKCGNEIKPGSYIVYGHALGRCAGLRFGKVLKLKAEMVKENRGTKWECDKLDVKITVQGVDDDWSGREPSLTERIGTLMFPDRIIVLPATQLPEKIYELLRDVPLRN